MKLDLSGDLHLHIHVHDEPDKIVHDALAAILHQVNINTHTLNQIKMTSEELIVVLTGIGTELDKVSEESAATLAEVKTLQDTIAGMGDSVPQSVVDAVNSIALKVKAVDDLIPDAPVVADPPPADPV